MTLFPYLVALQIISFFLFGQNTTEFQHFLAISTTVSMALYVIQYIMPFNNITAAPSLPDNAQCGQVAPASSLTNNEKTVDIPATEVKEQNSHPSQLAVLDHLNTKLTSGFMGSHTWVNYTFLGIQSVTVFFAQAFLNIPPETYEALPLLAFFTAALHAATIREQRRDIMWYFCPAFMTGVATYLAIFGISTLSVTLSYIALSITAVYSAWQATLYLSKGVAWALPRLMNPISPTMLNALSLQGLLLSSALIVGNAYLTTQLNETPWLVGSSIGISATFVFLQLKTLLTQK